MPTIDVSISELEKLLNLKLDGDITKLDEILAFVKSEVKLLNQDEDLVSVEIKDTNRPDLWGIEGLARALRGYLNLSKGAREYKVGKPIVDVFVDSRLANIRPFLGCAIIKNVKLTDTIIRGLMHMQDKLDQTYGRSRQKTSIGLYDFSLIEPPLSYTVSKPDETSFVPLGFTERMTLRDILKKHSKGIEYGHIVKKHNVYPILMDSKKRVLSFPPIINSNDLGKVSAETRHVLVEVTGTLHETVLNTLKLISLALVDRGGTPYATTVHYASKPKRKVITPEFSSKIVELDIEYASKVLGLELTGKRIASLLGKAGFGVQKIGAESVTVQVPSYRIDVMHQVDLIEDLAIAYGYNNIKPLWRDLPTTGCARSEQRWLNIARELMVGLGFQEILTYTMTSPENLLTRMNLTEGTGDHCGLVEIANPKVVTMTCLRNWLLPSLMEFLSNNQSVEFPQKIFELGKVTLLDESKETRTKDEEILAAVITHPNANFSEIKSAVDALLMNLGVPWQTGTSKHSSFIEGRLGEIVVNGATVGVLGEISPIVLGLWKLENPVVAFELDVAKALSVRMQ